MVLEIEALLVESITVVVLSEANTRVLFLVKLTIKVPVCNVNISTL